MLNREQQLLESFPRLREGFFRIESIPNQFYNCVALAVGVNRFYWQPTHKRKGTSSQAIGFYWPPGILTEEEDIHSYIFLFGLLGYLQCEDGHHIPGQEKIAIYTAQAKFSHVARQRLDGLWWSKLGPNEDIVHEHATGLNDAYYGNVSYYLVRPYNPSADHRIRELMSDYTLPNPVGIDEYGLLDLARIQLVDSVI